MLHMIWLKSACKVKFSFGSVPCHNIETPQVRMSCLADLASQLGMMDT
jgi:hypothetical protein